MTGDETHDRSCTASAESKRPDDGSDAERTVPILGAYDAVKGRDAFILADADSDDAWLAVEVGGERTLGEWR